MKTIGDSAARRAISLLDFLFESGGGISGLALAHLLGQDGLLGTMRLRELGAQVVIQDEATSVVWGMPGAVANAGLADRVLPLDLVVPEILRLARGA